MRNRPPMTGRWRIQPPRRPRRMPAPARTTQTALGGLTMVTAVAVLTGCGLTGPATYDLDDTTVEAAPGEEFTLSVPSSASLGEHWYVADPRPDRRVVRATGEEDRGGGGDADGAGGGTHLFGFRAVGRGNTTIRLIHCPVGACIDKGDSATASPPPTAGPTAAPARSQPDYRTYTVTVE
ncbi:protease inhibitor I42 family protein [Streptomyces sp. NPDC058773]|uniref:protease inhibitor I42 family protein n=1 Tax=Streptomyces sp. NPDC058773 TaxID=3346632 RepID=UPI0036CCF2C3